MSTYKQIKHWGQLLHQVYTGREHDACSWVLFNSIHTIYVIHAIQPPEHVAESVRGQASHAEGPQFESRTSQTNKLPNLYLSVPSLTIVII